MTTYRVVHTGDSISCAAWDVASSLGGRQWVEGDTWRNLEYGRDGYVSGANGWQSTASIWPLLRDRSEPGGWLIIQDNGMATSDVSWRTLMEQICIETPSDRTLIVVLPGYRSDVNAVAAATVAARARIMREVFAIHPAVVFVHLDQYVKRNPGRFADGQHPDAAGAAWLKAAIVKWTDPV